MRENTPYLTTIKKLMFNIFNSIYDDNEGTTFKPSTFAY